MDGTISIKEEPAAIKMEPMEFVDDPTTLDSAENIPAPNTSQLEPEPFCSLCLRDRVPNTVFYTYDMTSSGSLRDRLKEVFLCELPLRKCYVCTPCRKLMKLMESFRACCLKSVECRIGFPGNLKMGEDRWFSDGTLKAIDLVRDAIEERIKLISEYDMVGTSGAKVQMETEESKIDNESNATSRQQIKECNSCRRKFNGPRSYSAHLKRCKTTELSDNLHSCHICLVSFRREPDLEAHVNMHDGNKPYECRVTCGERFYGKNQRYRHEKLCRKQLGLEKESSESSDLEPDDEPMEINECEKCHRRFDGKLSLKSHKTQCQTEGEAKRLFTCDICSISFITKQMLKAHLNKHEGIKPYKCRKSCDKKFYGAVSRYRHEKACREVEVKAIECVDCHRFFTGKQGLYMHAKSCRKGQKDDRTMFICDICSISFTHKHQLEFHRNKHKGIKPFECQFNCGKSFFGSQPLKKHAKICTRRPLPMSKEPNNEETIPPEPEAKPDEEPTLEVIQCENCERLFDSKGALMSHLKFCRPDSIPSDKDQLLYICPICSIPFTRKPRLEAHLNKHNGVKAFKCLKCGQKFFNLKPKNQHQKNCNVHRCQTCKAEFSTSNALVNHVKETHAKGKITCETCGAQFLRNSNFMRHRQKKHPEESATVFGENAS